MHVYSILCTVVTIKSMMSSKIVSVIGFFRLLLRKRKKQDPRARARAWEGRNRKCKYCIRRTRCYTIDNTIIIIYVCTTTALFRGRVDALMRRRSRTRTKTIKSPLFADTRAQRRRPFCRCSCYMTYYYTSSRALCDIRTRVGK